MEIHSVLMGDKDWTEFVPPIQVETIRAASFDPADFDATGQRMMTAAYVSSLLGISQEEAFELPDLTATLLFDESTPPEQTFSKLQAMYKKSFIESLELPLEITETPEFRAGLAGEPLPEEPEAEKKPLSIQEATKRRREREILAVDRTERGLPPLPGVDPISITELMIARTQARRVAFVQDLKPFLTAIDERVVAKGVVEFLDNLVLQIGQDIPAAISQLSSDRIYATRLRISAWLDRIAAGVIEVSDPTAEVYSLRERADFTESAAVAADNRADRDYPNIIGIPLPDDIGAWVEASRKPLPPTTPAGVGGRIGAKILEFWLLRKGFAKLLGIGKATQTTTLVPVFQVGQVPLIDPGKISLVNTMLRESLALGGTSAALEAAAVDSTPQSISESFAVGFVAAPIFRAAAVQLERVPEFLKQMKFKASEAWRFSRIRITTPGGKVTKGTMSRARVDAFKDLVRKNPEQYVDLVPIPKNVIPGGVFGGQISVAVTDATLTPFERGAAMAALGVRAGVPALRAGRIAVPGEPTVPGEPVPVQPIEKEPLRPIVEIRKELDELSEIARKRFVALKDDSKFKQAGEIDRLDSEERARFESLQQELRTTTIEVMGDPKERVVIKRALRKADIIFDAEAPIIELRNLLPTPAQPVVAPEPTLPAEPVGEGIPKIVQRIEEAGELSTVGKPQGLYTTPIGVESPHADLGGRRFELSVNPNANILQPESQTNVVSAGIAALKELLPPQEYEALIRIPSLATERASSRIGRKALTELLASKFPDVEWGRFFDQQEMLEGYAGELARQQGFDAIWLPDEQFPAFSEFVGLTEKAFRPISQPAQQPLAPPPVAAPEPVPPAEPVVPKPVPTVKPTKKVVTKPAPPVTEAADRKLRQKIQAIKATKGLTETAFKEMKRKVTASGQARSLIRMTTAELEAMLKKVERARPKRIGHRQVITKKTETKIQSLKTSLTKQEKMTDEAFAEILQKEISGRVPKFIDAKSFITEQQGKEILKRMLNSAEIIGQVAPVEKAIQANDDIAKEVAKLDTRLAKAPTRDPFSLESMRYYNQQMQNVTGAPIFTAYQSLIDAHDLSDRTRAATMASLETSAANFKQIATDPEAVQRITDYIESQTTLKGRPETPKDITQGEVAVAKEIQRIFKDYEIKARTAKFYNWYYYKKPIAQFDKFKKEINKAVDIYEGQGEEALIEYLKTQEWGVIRSGYSPMESIIQKIRLHDPGAATVGKSAIEIRTSLDYHDQERNIFQRLSSYMRQMDLLADITPKINAYIQLVDDNLALFKNPGRVKGNVESFLKVLKRYDSQGGFFERIIARAYSQAMRTIIMPSPVLSFRNLFQNFAFEQDRTTLVDPRNKRLTKEDIAYLETFVLQTRQMVEQYFMVGEKPLPGFGWLTKIVDKIKIYPYSDIANRHWAFWAKINQVRRALEADTIEEMMKEARFNDITEIEQRRALGILAKDGGDAMARYVARVHTDDIHFLYDRAQRSPAETTPVGKIVGNLMLFPRAYTERIAKNARKVFTGKTHNARWRGLKTVFGTIAGGLIAGSIYQKITGRTRNPYNPLEMLMFRPGGLAFASVEAITEVSGNFIRAAQGDKRALAALVVAIPKAANMFIPFYDYTLRGYEALTDQKNVDRKILRQLRQIIDKEYKLRGGVHKVQRDAVQKWQFFLAGAGVDQKAKKKQRTTKKRRRRGSRVFN